MKIFIVIFIILFGFEVKSQTVHFSQQDTNYVKIVLHPDSASSMKKFRDYIINSFKIPEEIIDNGVKINMKIEFSIDESGKMVLIKLHQDPGFGILSQINNLFEKFSKRYEWVVPIEKGDFKKNLYSIPISIIP